MAKQTLTSADIELTTLGTNLMGQFPELFNTMQGALDRGDQAQLSRLICYAKNYANTSVEILKQHSDALRGATP